MLVVKLPIKGAEGSDKPLDIQLARRVHVERKAEAPVLTEQAQNLVALAERHAREGHARDVRYVSLENCGPGRDSPFDQAPNADSRRIKPQLGCRVRLEDEKCRIGTAETTR